MVALESTIYTHGALGNDLDLEGVVRRNGGVPAVVGILAGVPTVGLLPDEVARMVEGHQRRCLDEISPTWLAWYVLNPAVSHQRIATHAFRLGLTVSCCTGSGRQ